MKKIIFSGSIITLLLFSCAEERFDIKDENNATTVSLTSIDTKMKTSFAKSFAKALKDHKELRDFIKSEALKKINKDYDVVYHAIKNKPLVSVDAKGSTTSTLHDLLLPYFESETELIEIENRLPLLTIFVPDLQEESFSPERWDTLGEVPYVAVRTFESNDIPIYKADGTNFVIEAQYMPDFPVVVIKDNERIVSNQSQEEFNNLDTRIITEANDAIQLRFSDDNFDSRISNSGNPPVTPTNYPRVDQIHAQAYNVYQNYTPGGWQRDYIYYGLTPTNTEGGINPTYREELTSFKLQGNPVDAYNYIADQQDPNLTSGFIVGNNSGWTDGSFEFGISLNYGAKNSNLGLELKKGFGVAPQDLFDVTYRVYIPGVVKRATITGVKMIDFYNNPNNRIQFSVWDLANYSNQFKISFEEVDTTTTYTNTNSATNKFNTNFSLEPSTGILKKIGLKLGASYEHTQTNTYVTQYTDISDNLYSADINFYDNVVNMVNSQLIPNKYYTGKVEFEFRPRQTY